MDLPDGLLTLLRQPSQCFLATSMADGSPHLTQTWVDTDGQHILINTMLGSQKIKNVERDPRVAVNILDPDNPFRYFAIRGHVVNMIVDGAAEHMDTVALRYTGAPYSWYPGQDQTRVLLTIQADRISYTG